MNEEQLEKLEDGRKEVEKELGFQEENEEAIEMAEIAVFGLAVGFILTVVSVYWIGNL